MLGGNRQILARFADYRRVLASVSMSRADSLDKVVRALNQLRQLSDDLEAFRRRVATGTADNSIPIEAHLESLKMGIRRLGQFKHGVAEQ